MIWNNKIQAVRYSAIGKYRLTRDLGVSVWNEVFVELWPILDASLAAAIYRHNKPLAVSAFLADKLHVPRCGPGIERVPPADELIDLAHDWFASEDYRPRASSFGGTTVVCLAETDIVITAPLTDREFDTVFRRSDWDTFCLTVAAGEARVNWDTSLLPISHTGKVTEIAWEVSAALGYEQTDHSWVPQTWTERAAPPNFPILYEDVFNADGELVTLRSIPARTRNHDVHLVRLWLNERNETRLPILTSASY